LQIPENKHVLVQLLTPEDGTLNSEELSPEARWSYYVSSYTMRDPTEGVPFSQMRMPFLKRNLPPKLDSDEEYNRYYKPLVSQEGLIIRICANSYHVLYEPGTEEWWCREPSTQEEQAELAADRAAVKEKRRDRFTEKFVNNPSWAHGLSKDEVDLSNQRFRSWVGEIDASLRARTRRDEAPSDVQPSAAAAAVTTTTKVEEPTKEDVEMADVAQESAAAEL
jgi:paired amphipathic helix protein Sin3a